eukprot:CAMPEP_0185448712 /NCGR_PEP_ID=MMETSP1365-20130426/59350_1 /TAXON_ID=38817 /ORGANISM="Gephyrocapsa oceanica, Strain RCC1303" /LENGTH=104 /DNA_ID=CAMNT_0028054701 /DNA_START=448 /DNA_END=759 /DNA_ORIENTATION=+
MSFATASITTGVVTGSRWTPGEATSTGGGSGSGVGTSSSAAGAVTGSGVWLNQEGVIVTPAGMARERSSTAGVTVASERWLAVGAARTGLSVPRTAFDSAARHA